MTEAWHHDREELDTSLALPPLYVLRAAERCPGCGRTLYLFALGRAAFYDAEDRSPIEDFHLLHQIRRLPDQAVAMLTSKFPGFRFDSAEPGFEAYLINHCPRGATLDEEFVHGDDGAAFCPATPVGNGQLRLFRLPIHEGVPVETIYSLGCGDYLDYQRTRPWRAL